MKKNNAKIAFSTLIVPLILLIMVDVIAIRNVFPIFSYTGLKIDASLLDFITHLAFFITPVYINYKLNKNNFIIFLILLTLHLPISSFYYVSDLSFYYFALETIAIFIMLVICVLPIKISGDFFSRTSISLIGFLFLFFLTLLLLINRFWTYLSFDLSELYYQRDQAQGLYQYGLQYLLVWAYKIAIPCLLSAAYFSKRWGTVSLLILASALLLFLTFRKEVVLYPLLALLLTWVIKSDRDISSWLSLSQLLLLVLFLSFGILFGSEIGTSYVHRTYVVVGHNFSDYIQFFAVTDYLWFSQSFLSGVFESGLSEKVPIIIGGIRYGYESNTFSNAGFWASAYMQGGPVMMIIYSIIVGLTANIVVHNIRSISSDRYRTVAVVASTCGFLQLVNGDLPTAVLTHGLGPAIVIVFMMRSLDNMKYRNNRD